MSTINRFAALGFLWTLAVLAFPAQSQVLSGVIRDASLLPVPNVDVRLFDQNGGPIGLPPTFSDLTGFYQISGLPTARYQLSFDPPTSTSLTPQLIDGLDFAGSMTLDVSLQPGYILSGFVRDENANPLADIDLNVLDSQGKAVFTPGDNTDLTGFYDITLAPGNYTVEWRSVTGVIPYITVTQLVTINAPTSMNVTLEIGMFVSGTVRDDLGSPILNANLDFIDTTSGIKLITNGDNTNLLGFYQVQIPVGTYRIIVKIDAALGLLPGDQTIAITADTVVDFALLPGISLSGHITNGAAAAIVGVDIDVCDAITGQDLLTIFDSTDSLGHYQVNVPPGRYNVGYQPLFNLALAPVLVPGVDVLTTTVQDVVLPNAITISGTVTDNLGAAVSGVDIDAKDMGGFSVPLMDDVTDFAGNYAIRIAPGTYTLEYEPLKVTGLVPRRITGMTLPVSFAIPIALQAGHHISGTVTDAAATPMPRVGISGLISPFGLAVFMPDNKSDALGQYDVVVPSGLYDFAFTPDSSIVVASPLLISSVLVAQSQTIDATFDLMIPTDALPAPPQGSRISLLPNYPNPFNPVTTIPFEINRPSRVELEIYSMRGVRIRRLTQGAYDRGFYQVTWNGLDDLGRRVASGVYVYRLRAAGENVQARKMLLLK